MRLYALGSAKAREAGLILADTKFEFGIDLDDQLYLIDEALTPDSSRFWPADQYTPGQAQTAFDKQYVRDYLETLDWDKTAPGPELPEEVVRKTQELYLQALKHLVG
jgi:phosphoribosylaminoimidazole-succinocarboxamide synthase